MTVVVTVVKTEEGGKDDDVKDDGNGDELLELSR